MGKTALQKVIDTIGKDYIEFDGIKNLLEEHISYERKQIEAAYRAGQNDTNNTEGADKYYFMTYMDND
jgi:hypothetical protein